MQLYFAEINEITEKYLYVNSKFLIRNIWENAVNDLTTPKGAFTNYVYKKRGGR